MRQLELPIHEPLDRFTFAADPDIKVAVVRLDYKRHGYTAAISGDKTTIALKKKEEPR